MHSLFISNRTRIVLKEITFVLLLHAVDRDEFRKGGTFPYDDDTDVSQERNKCCSMRWIDLLTELVLRQILKIDSADHLFLRKKKKTSARHPSKITISGVSPPCILLLPGSDQCAAPRAMQEQGFCIAIRPDLIGMKNISSKARFKPGQNVHIPCWSAQTDKSVSSA